MRRIILLAFLAGILCSCSKKSNVPEEINNLSIDLTKIGEFSYRVRSQIPADMIFIASPYVTEKGVKEAVSGRYDLRASALTEVVETMGIREKEKGSVPGICNGPSSRC